MTRFCRLFCGICLTCRKALHDLERQEAIYASLSDADRDSLTTKDPDDPRSFALDRTGKP